MKRANEVTTEENEYCLDGLFDFIDIEQHSPSPMEIKNKLQQSNKKNGEKWNTSGGSSSGSSIKEVEEENSGAEGNSSKQPLQPASSRSRSLVKIVKLLPKRNNAKTYNILGNWLINHMGNPFPSVFEKSELAHSTGMTSLQVGTWMTNIRKRRLYPLVQGRRKAKTELDFRMMEMHARLAMATKRAPKARGREADRSSFRFCTEGEDCNALKDILLDPIDGFLDFANEIGSDDESSDGKPEELTADRNSKPHSYPSVHFTNDHTMELSSPSKYSCCENLPVLANRSPLEVACNCSVSDVKFGPYAISPNLFKGSFDVFDDEVLMAFSPDIRNKQMV